jgi:hypothetical protein
MQRQDALYSVPNMHRRLQILSFPPFDGGSSLHFIVGDGRSATAANCARGRCEARYTARMNLPSLQSHIEIHNQQPTTNNQQPTASGPATSLPARKNTSSHPYCSKLQTHVRRLPVCLEWPHGVTVSRITISTTLAILMLHYTAKPPLITSNTT